MNRRLRTALLFAGGAYLLLIHAVLIVLVLKTNFLLLAGKTLGWIPPEEWTDQLVSHVLDQAEQDVTVSAGAVILVGDSIVAQLNAGQVGPGTVNFGLGGDTTHTLYARLPVLRSLAQSRAVVLEVGVNDLKYRPVERIARDYGAVLGRLASAPKVVALSVLPVDAAGTAAHARPYLRNEQISALNAALRRECGGFANCRFLDVWSAFIKGGPDLYASDGWHMSAAGNDVLAAAIRGALQSP